jgi:hypothetical protein
MCQASSTALIATLTDERTLDIYLCRECQAQFSYERPQKAAEQTELRGATVERDAGFPHRT